MDERVKRRRGYTRISRKHQVTIPVEALREAGFVPGQELRVEVRGPGEVALVETQDPVEEFSGTIRYPPGYLEALRAEWDRSSPAAEFDDLGQ